MASSDIGPPEKLRWYILITFSLISCWQSNSWFTFSSVPEQVQDYYHLEKPSKSGQVNGVIDLLLNWGPIMFIPMTPFSAYLLSYPITGFKYTAQIAGILAFSGTLIRCIPTILDQLPFIDYQVSSDFWKCLIFLHLGQILNAIAGPFVMAPPSKLSVIWFGEEERGTATGIAALSNTLGYCLGFVIGPLIVTEKEYFPYLLYLDLVLVSIPFVCVMVYFPPHPTKLPSVAAQYALKGMNVSDGAVPAVSEHEIDADHSDRNLSRKLNVNSDWNLISNDDLDGVQQLDLSPNVIDYRNMKDIEDQQTKQQHSESISFSSHFMSFWWEIRKLLCFPSALAMTIIGGMVYGIFAAWSSVLQDMIGSSTSINLDETTIGFIGFAISGMSVVGGFAIGPIADRCFQRKLKRLLLILFGFAILILAVLLFVLPSPFDKDSMFILNADSTKQEKVMVIAVLVSVMGLFEGALIPLFFELAADISYPISEGTSATVIVLFNNVICLVCIGVGAWMSTKWETFFALIVCGICVVVLCAVKEQYNRPS